MCLQGTQIILQYRKFHKITSFLQKIMIIFCPFSIFLQHEYRTNIVKNYSNVMVNIFEIYEYRNENLTLEVPRNTICS